MILDSVIQKIMYLYTCITILIIDIPFINFLFQKYIEIDGFRVLQFVFINNHLKDV